MIYGLPFQGASYPVTSGFGPRNSPTAGASSYHWGYDFGTPLGTPLYAPVGATVDFMGADTADLDGDGVPDGLGNYLRLLMPGGEQMYYGHLDRFAPGLEVGAAIEPGTLLAYTGSSGISTGPHLDIRMRDAEGNMIDPTPFLGLNHEGGSGLGNLVLDDEAVHEWASAYMPLSRDDPNAPTDNGNAIAGHRDPYVMPTGADAPGNPIYSIPENAISDSYNQYIAPQTETQGQPPMLGLLSDNQITGGLLGQDQQGGGFMDGVNMPLLMAGAQILANSGPSLQPRSMFEGVPNALMGGVQAQEARARAQEERQRRLQREQAQQRLMQSGLLSPEMQAAVEAGYGDQVMAGLFSQPETPSLIRTAQALGIPLDDPRLIEAALNTGGPSVNVNMPPQQNEFEEAVGAGQGERYVGWLTAGDAASGTMNVINQALPIIEQARTGFAEETLADFQRAADQLLGPGAVNIGDPSGIAQFNALVNELVLTQADRMAGVLSDSDIALLRSTMANSGNDPETNRRIMEFLRARTQWAIDRAAAAQAYVDQNGNITGFTFDPIPPMPRFGTSGGSTGGSPSGGLLDTVPPELESIPPDQRTPNTVYGAPGATEGWVWDGQQWRRARNNSGTWETMQ